MPENPETEAFLFVREHIFRDVKGKLTSWLIEKFERGLEKTFSIMLHVSKIILSCLILENLFITESS